MSGSGGARQDAGTASGGAGGNRPGDEDTDGARQDGPRPKILRTLKLVLFSRMSIGTRLLGVHLWKICAALQRTAVPEVSESL
jgi:hypothetical protein